MSTPIRSLHPPRTALVVRVVLVALVLSLVVAASLFIGASSLGGSDVGAVLAARGDRTLLGLLVGAGVAVSGAALQGLTRNPLADPGILGINAGASLAVVLGITFFGLGSLLGYVGFALVGAAIAAITVAILATLGARGLGANGPSPLSMTLAGLVFTAMTTSVASAVLVAHTQSLDVYRFWQVGSVSGRDLSSIIPTLPLFIVGFGVLFLSGGKLDLLAMGDSLARGLGAKPERLRLIIGAAAVILAAVCTAIAGPISFVGLVASHILRPIVGTSYRVLLPLSAFVGGGIVVLADTLGRVISPPGEVQAGIMTAVFGCPALLWVIARMRSL